jgi:hypothetical protein
MLAPVFPSDIAMIDTVDVKLTTWADKIVGKGFTSLAAPGVRPTPRGVSLYLLDLIPTLPPRSAKTVRLEVSLRYLVSSWSEKPAEAHKLVGDLLFAALENSEFTVETTAVPMEVWRSLGTPPTPAFVLKVPLYKDLPQRQTKYVRQFVLETVPSVSLSGLVTGPGDIPLSGALVQLPSLNLDARTDYRGRFQFRNVAAEPLDQILLVRAKGREQTFRTAENRGPDGIIRVHFQLEED